MKGEVKLYDTDGNLVDSRMYKSKVEREKIVFAWKRMYSNRQLCAIQINPEVNTMGWNLDNNILAA